MTSDFSDKNTAPRGYVMRLKYFFRQAYVRFCPESFKRIVTRIRISPIGSSIASGAFWSMTGSVFSRAFIVVATVWVARILGKICYGEYGLIISTVNSFILFSSVGIGMTATKYVSEFAETDKERAGKIIGLSYLTTLGAGILLTVVFLILAPWISNHVMKSPHLVNELRLGILFVVIAAINAAQLGILTGFQAFREIATVNILFGLVVIPFRVIGAWVGGLGGVVVGFGLSLLVLLALNRYFITKLMKRYCLRVSWRFAFDELPILWKFSLPAVLSSIIITPAYWLCYLMLARSESGISEVALLDAARQYQLMILFVPGTISRVVLPMLVRVNNEENSRRFSLIIKYNLLLNGGITAVMCLPIVVFSPWLMSIYGNGFTEGTSTLCLLAFTSIVISLHGVVGQILASREKLWVSFILNFIWFITLISVCYIMTTRNTGAFGVAVAILFAYVVQFICISSYVMGTGELSSKRMGGTVSTKEC